MEGINRINIKGIAILLPLLLLSLQSQASRLLQQNVSDGTAISSNTETTSVPNCAAGSAYDAKKSVCSTCATGAWSPGGEGKQADDAANSLQTS